MYIECAAPSAAIKAEWVSAILRATEAAAHRAAAADRVRSAACHADADAHVPDGQQEQRRAALVAFYRQHAPEKAGAVDGLLQYPPDVLASSLQLRYGACPEGWADERLPESFRADFAHAHADT